jgi:hypothetical protein
MKKGIWKPNGIGDFDFFSYLFDSTNEIFYVDFPLTGINYKEKISGWSAL